VTIIGAGFNTPEKNLAWSEKEKFPYEVWTDTDKTLALAYGAAVTADQDHPHRVTVVLDAHGDMVLRYPEVGVGTHPEDVLEDVRVLFPK
jgi:peroxiredoxin